MGIKNKKFGQTAIVGFFLVVTFLLPQETQAAAPVRIIEDISDTSVQNLLKNTFTLDQVTQSTKDIASLILKEFKLDPLVHAQKAQLQQQLTSDMLKMLGGQLPGQNGQVPFVQNFSEHSQDIFRKAGANYIFGEATVNQCSEKQTYLNKVAAYQYYLDRYEDNQSGTDGGSQNQCTAEGNGTQTSGSQNGQNKQGRRALDQILVAYDSCKDGICQGLKAQKDLDVSLANAIDNDKRAVVDGFLPKKTCKDLATGDNPAGPTGNSSSWGGNSARPDCEIVTPARIIADSASFGVSELPALQLLNSDEYNEIISNFMSNLTNQAIAGVNGLLGLSGNPEYSVNVFGESGNQSYATALAEDKITDYQYDTANPIKEALAAERKYMSLQNKVLSEISELEMKLASNTEEFSDCFDMELTEELLEAKENALNNVEVSSTTLAILILLDNQYDAATEPGVRSAVLNTFTTYKNQNYFRTELDNKELEVSYINYTFARMVDEFKYEMAVEKFECGGEFDYDGILNATSTDEEIEE